MDCREIIQSLEKYKKEEFTSNYLEETIKYYLSHEKSGNIKVKKIPENEMMLTGIKINILYNDYNVYLTPGKYDPELCHRQLNLSEAQSNNLKNQIIGIKKNSFLICDKLKNADTNLVLVLSKRPIPLLKDYVIERDVYNILLGVNSLLFLQYQNLDRYCDESVLKFSKEIYEHLDVYRAKIKKLSNLEQERIFIFSGLIYQFLGALYSQDIDVLVMIKNGNDNLINYFQGININKLEPTFIDIAADDKSYKMQWFINKLPNLNGAENIYEMLINPKYHFHYMGLKCFDIFTNMKRSISRSHPFSFIDIFLLNKFNKIDFPDDLCIKNITIRQGKANLVTKKRLEDFYLTMQRYLKEWYGIQISTDTIRRHFMKCDEKFSTIYREFTSNIDPLVKLQAKLHRQISQKYITKYGKNKTNLLDVGSGKLTGAYIYSNLHIKNVYAVEPSIYSIERAKEISKKYPNVNFVLINSRGDVKLNINEKFDVITFIFTIHYMVNNLDIVIENIKRLSKSGTNIIITCINGNKLIELLKKNEKYEITYNNDIYWGCYVYNNNINIKNPKVLFYMKDVFGVENGSEEYLLDIKELINVFKQNNIKLIYENSFLNEYNSYHSNVELKQFQKNILDLHHVLIFNVI